VQEMELMHKDARSDAAALRRQCAEIKAASESATEAHSVQLESITAQWEFRLSKRESDLLATQKVLKSQLSTFQQHSQSMQQELKDSKAAFSQEQQSAARGLVKVKQELQEARVLADEAKAQCLDQEQKAHQKDAEIKSLHRQVCDNRR
jgi:hypothetical protein